MQYEAEMNHLSNSLINETCLLLYPWVFKDEDGHKRDKRSSPPYMDLIENVLPNNYNIEQELRKRLDEEIITAMLEKVSNDYITNKKKSF